MIKALLEYTKTKLSNPSARTNLVVGGFGKVGSIVEDFGNHTKSQSLTKLGQNLQQHASTYALAAETLFITAAGFMAARALEKDEENRELDGSADLLSTGSNESLTLNNYEPTPPVDKGTPMRIGDYNDDKFSN